MFVCDRRWRDEPQKGLGERPGPGRLSGLVVQKEGEQRALGLEVEEVLVCAQEMFALLVHVGHGKLRGFFSDNMWPRYGKCEHVRLCLESSFVISYWK